MPVKFHDKVERSEPGRILFTGTLLYYQRSTHFLDGFGTGSPGKNQWRR